MNIIELINHPETMNKDTLYDLRSLLALNPYHQPARLLLLENLFILHDPSFDEELRRAAIYITERRAIFNLVEAAHYRLNPEKIAQEAARRNSVSLSNEEHRTEELIDNFLETQPEPEEKESTVRRRPTPIDATVDYVSYLLELEREEAESKSPATEPTTEVKKESETIAHQEQSIPSRTSELIDGFINSPNQHIQLNDDPQLKPELPANHAEENEGNDEYITETLAHIYIKQGRYSQALEIIKRLNLNYPKKSIYFADQIRFLEKLVANSKYKQK